MSARGIKVNYDNQNYSARATGLSIPMTLNDIVVTDWMNIRGNNSSDRGQCPLTLFDSNGNTEVTFIDGTFNGTSPWSITSYDVNVTNDTVGSWAPKTGENWFYVRVWSATDTRWYYYAAKDGDATLGSIANGALARTVRTFDQIWIGSQAFGSYGNNTEHTNAKIWSGAGIAATFLANSGALILAEMKHELPQTLANLVAHYKLLSSSDLTDYSGNGHTLAITGVVNDGTMDPVDIQSSVVASGGLTFGGLSIRH